MGLKMKEKRVYVCVMGSLVVSLIWFDVDVGTNTVRVGRGRGCVGVHDDDHLHDKEGLQFHQRNINSKIYSTGHYVV